MTPTESLCILMYLGTNEIMRRIIAGELLKSNE
jgi:alkylation response protein AidB-like acyl-CoA dehydrogenase